MVSIHLRPPEIEDQLMPAHWKGNLIKDKGSASAVGTLVERTNSVLHSESETADFAGSCTTPLPHTTELSMPAHLREMGVKKSDFEPMLSNVLKDRNALVALAKVLNKTLLKSLKLLIN